jgi:hypothetical protein
MRWERRSSNWTSFSSPWARAWDGHEVVDLAVGRLALHYAEENPDEVLAALDDKTEAVIRSSGSHFLVASVESPTLAFPLPEATSLRIDRMGEQKKWFKAKSRPFARS